MNKESPDELIPFMVRRPKEVPVVHAQAQINPLPFVLDYMDAGGRATHGAVAESLSKDLFRLSSNIKLNFCRYNC
jgi:hypothetical protein